MISRNWPNACVKADRLTAGLDDLDESQKYDLLEDLRQVLVAIRIAAFDLGLHGKDAGLDDHDIVAELEKHAKLDYEIRGEVLRDRRRWGTYGRDRDFDNRYRLFEGWVRDRYAYLKEKLELLGYAVEEP